MKNTTIYEHWSKEQLQKPGEILLERLISRYHFEHKDYINNIKNYGMWGFILLVSIVLTSVIFIFLWFIDGDEVFDKILTVISAIVLFGSVIAYFRYGLFKSKKKLQKLKDELESIGYCIALKKEDIQRVRSSRVHILDQQKVSEKYKVFPVYDAIDFRKYNIFFNIR
ncbi:MAG: hypothetical protein JRD05_10480 [Deltaproteobacteria bacterium]|nr:hypothetical protein [Deltaproteobacteria bacterium]